MSLLLHESRDMRDPLTPADVPPGPASHGKFAMVALLTPMLPTLGGFGWSIGGSSGGSGYISDIMLPLACLIIAPAACKTRGSWLGWCLCGLVVLGLIIGPYHGATLRLLIRDGRAPVYMIAGLFIAFYLVRDRQNWRWYGTAALVLLALNAVLLLFDQVTGAGIVGGTQDTTLYYGRSAIRLSSARSELPSDGFALATVCGLAGAFLSGADLQAAGLGGRRGAVGFISGLVILFFSYSRNTVLGLAAVCLIALAAPVGRGHFSMLIHKLEGMVRALVTITIVIAALALPVGLAVAYGVGSRQLSTFSARVVGGLSSRALNSDTSVYWRRSETHLAFVSVKRHPWAGVGIGAYYRPNVVGEPFVADYGRTYVHDYYLEMLVKLGILGCIPLFLLVAVALARLLFQPGWPPIDRSVRLCAGCALAALLAVAVVAPWPDQRDSAALFGALVAMGWLAAPSDEPPVDDLDHLDEERRVAALAS